MASSVTIKWFVGVASKEDLKKLLRSLGKEHHPDAGGNGETMKEINVEYEFLLKRNVYPVQKPVQQTNYQQGGQYSNARQQQGYNPFAGFSGFNDLSDFANFARKSADQEKAREKYEQQHKSYMGDDFFNDGAFKGFYQQHDHPDPLKVYKQKAQEYYTHGYCTIKGQKYGPKESFKQVVKNAMGFCRGCDLKLFDSVKGIVDIYMKETKSGWGLPAFYHLCKEAGQTADVAAQLAYQYKID